MSGPGVSNAGLSSVPTTCSPSTLCRDRFREDFISRERSKWRGKRSRGWSTRIITAITSPAISSSRGGDQQPPYCRNEVLKAIPATARTWTATPNVAQGGEPRVLVPPTVTFKDDLTYFLGDTEVRLLFAGPAHTWGDLMAYLPQHKILFAGDVAFFWVAPYANNSYITKWIETCDKIAGWDVDVIVPGHGPIAGKKELAEMANYFRTLGVEARKRYDAKMTAGAAAAEIRLGRFDNWVGPERLIMDTVRWYQEWDGDLTPDYDANRSARSDH
jgi:glyoxylase-like metal-dependent hydrolase (beta-lactamase superfamily II)